MAILQLSESGELKYLQDKWWASSCVGADTASTSEALQPHDLQGLFLLLGLGLGLGLLLALLELVSRAHHQAKDGKVGGGGASAVWCNLISWRIALAARSRLLSCLSEIVLHRADGGAASAIRQRTGVRGAGQRGHQQSLRSSLDASIGEEKM